MSSECKEQGCAVTKAAEESLERLQQSMEMVIKSEQDTEDGRVSKTQQRKDNQLM
jgi:exonuclease VII small subunit